jgi:hypothetical protein
MWIAPCVQGLLKSHCICRLRRQPEKGAGGSAVFSGCSCYDSGMLSRETLEQYRRMTPGERLKLTLDMIRENTPYLLQGPPDVVDRRFELLRRQNDATGEC